MEQSEGIERLEGMWARGVEGNGGLYRCSKNASRPANYTAVCTCGRQEGATEVPLTATHEGNGHVHAPVQVLVHVVGVVAHGGFCFSALLSCMPTFTSNHALAPSVHGCLHGIGASKSFL